MKLKLLSFSPNSQNWEKVDFLISREGKPDFTIVLKEKANWPLIWGQPLEKVEKWFFNCYADLFEFPLSCQNLDYEQDK